MAPSPHTPTASTSTPSNVDKKRPSSHQDIFPTPQMKVRAASAPRRFEPKRAASTPPELTTDRVRSMRRGTPGDLPSVTTLQQSWDRQQLSTKRSQYFADAFAYREPKNTPKDRISKDSVIIAELKLSGALDENTSLVSDLSFHLAQTFQRPESSILLTVQDSTVLLFGGSYEPAYLLSISALTSEIAPTKNKRATALTQDFLREALGIPAKRGVVRFIPIAEENLGTNGQTTLGEIEELERSMNNEDGILRTISRNRSRKGKKTVLTPMFERSKTPAVLTPPHSKGEFDESGANTGTIDGEKKHVRRRKSFMAFFGVGS